MSSRRITVVASEVLGMAGTGGAGTADSLLAVALGRHDHDVELLVAPGRDILPLSPEWQSTYAASNVTVRRLEYGARVEPAFLAATTEVCRALMSDPPEIVVADDWRGLACSALRLRQAGAGLTATAFVVYCHGPGRSLTAAARKVPDTLARFGEDVAERACIELADAVVSPSAWLLGWMRERGWPLADTAKVVPYLWQSVALGEPAPRAPAAPSVRRLAFFGQLREGKGIRLYLAALQELDPKLLEGIELAFFGKESPRWTTARILDALGGDVAGRVAGVRFETELDRTAALAELRNPGTLAVMPSLVDNSPYAVAECLEGGIPFVAAAVGGIPELVAERDRDRVLCRPTADDLHAVLARALAGDSGFPPAEPARPGSASLDAWLELVRELSPRRSAVAPAVSKVSVVAKGKAARRRAARLADQTRSVETEIVAAESRADGVQRATADWILFLDDDDHPDDELVDSLVAAQAASGADVVTSAVRVTGEEETLRVFLGDAGALGLVENQYGVLGLVRKSFAASQQFEDAAVDPDWVLFSRAALAGARVLSVPLALSTHSGRVGTVADVPGDGVGVLAAWEEAGVQPTTDLAQLAATLGAAVLRLTTAAPATYARPAGLGGIARRLKARAGRGDG